MLAPRQVAVTVAMTVFAVLLPSCEEGGYQSYKDPGRGVSFSYPSKWQQRESQQLSPFFVWPDGDVSAGVTREAIAPGVTVRSHFATIDTRLRSAGYLELGDKEVQISGLPAVRAVYLNRGFVQVFYVVVSGDTAWSLILTCRSEDLIDWGPTFEAIANTLRVT
jgi:hypothetical protein